MKYCQCLFKPLNFLNYNKKNAVKELQDNYNWIPYSQNHFESRFTRFYEGYWLPSRYGFDMRRVEYSSLILSGQMKRNHALELIKNPPVENNLLVKDIEYVCSKLDINKKQLDEFHEMPKKYFYDYKNNYKLLSFGERLMNRYKIGMRGGAY